MNGESPSHIPMTDRRGFCTMSTEFPPRAETEDFNPYAPPVGAIGEGPIDLIPVGDLAAAEAIRREHIGHEASVKSLGLLHYLSAFLVLIGSCGLLFMGFKGQLQGGVAGSWLLIALGVVYLLLGALHLALGIGLTRLQTWARWTDAALISLSLMMVILGMVAAALTGQYPVLIGYSLGSLIAGYMLYLLVSPKSATIFAPGYKAIIAQTPHIKNRTSFALKIVLALFVTVIALAIVAAIVGNSR
jgi:hypothetical protein